LSEQRSSVSSSRLLIAEAEKLCPHSSSVMALTLRVEPPLHVHLGQGGQQRLHQVAVGLHQLFRQRRRRTSLTCGHGRSSFQGAKVDLVNQPLTMATPFRKSVRNLHTDPYITAIPAYSGYLP